MRFHPTRWLLALALALSCALSLAPQLHAQPGVGPISGGGGGGGLPGADEVTEAMLKSVDAAGDEECLTYESTVGDFEWQSCGAIGGSTGATDNVPLCADGTGGSTLGACTVAAFPAGSAAAPSVSVGDDNSGFYGAPGTLYSTTDGSIRWQLDAGAFRMNNNLGALIAGGVTTLYGFTTYVIPSTAGVGSPYSPGADKPMILITNEGSTALQYTSLPSAQLGTNYEACVQDSDGMRITAFSGDTIRNAANVTTSGGYVESTTIGSCINITAINVNEWMVGSITGTWSFN